MREPLHRFRGRDGEPFRSGRGAPTAVYFKYSREKQHCHERNGSRPDQSMNNHSMGCASNRLQRRYGPCPYSRYGLRPDASLQAIGDATRS
jgi:hypothetical protein